jgi:hypothetical protein
VEVTPDDGQVNSNYLSHVAAAAEQGLEATEDIVSCNGTKLLRRGARVDAAACERLLAHKLRKPLEECVQSACGVKPEDLEPLCAAWIERSPLLASLAADKRAQALPASLARVRLSAPVQSMLTLYGRSADDRLAHAVGVAGFALALARRVRPGDVDFHRLVTLAGLLHDVGELYIDPAVLRRGAALEPGQWRQVAAHPVLAQKVLAPMEGAGAALAEAIGLHHERADGLGYPRGTDSVTLSGQVLGAAEWMVGQLEAGISAPLHTHVVARLVPGEFDAPVIEALMTALPADAAKGDGGGSGEASTLLPRLREIGGFIDRFVTARDWIGERMATTSGEPHRALERALARLQRIQTGFVRSGLNAIAAGSLDAELACAEAPPWQVEVLAIVGELEWRIREFGRELRLRGALADDDADLIALLERLEAPA